MKTHRSRALFIAGFILLIGGAIDPLEGSIVIAIGSILIAISTAISKDLYRKYFFIAALLILTGIFFMRFSSYLGGFDPKTERYRFIPLAPFPIGWIMSVVLLMIKVTKKNK